MKQPSPRTQRIIFNLYGDYVRHIGDSAWTKGLLEVLGVLGVGQRAARTTLSRMKRRGWLQARRVGRHSLYRTTERTRDLLSEGAMRLFGPRPGAWDGRWTLLTYSLPGERRLTRHRLRTRLSWLGYGSLQPGTLVAAYPRADEARRVVTELDAAPYLHVFTGAHLDPEDQERIVHTCWDLPAIDARYATFVERYGPLVRRLRNRTDRDMVLSPQESFVQRFWATYDYSEFPRIDPLLPDELLPRRWRGHLAHELLAEVRARLEQPTWEYLRSIQLFATPDGSHSPAIRRSRRSAQRPSSAAAARPWTHGDPA